jgi:membrane-bound lytic murein transglycosylase B
VREKQKKEKAAPKAVPKAAPKPKVVQRAASPAPFEPTFEELLGHMGRAMAQQRAVRAQSRSDLYSQFLG